MSVMIETEKDETKSCVFHGFLNICSVDQNDASVVEMTLLRNCRTSV